ncbi:MAG: sel1 repeat family protein [Clostridiales bacterium]|nr:sel1 repeat family protein [Clostridiales bacterium]
MEEILLFRTLFAALLLKESSLNDQQFSDTGKSCKPILEEKLYTKPFVKVDQGKAANNLIEYEELILRFIGGLLCEKDYEELRHSFYSIPERERHEEYVRYAKPVIAEAKKGNVRAIYHLACLNLAGMGVPQDIKEGLTLLRRSALQGNLDAQVFCGQIYDNGSYCVRQDLLETLKWYRMAAKQGDLRSQIKLAVCYSHGHGMPQDLSYAYAWAIIGLSNPRINEDQKRILENITSEIKVALTPKEYKRIHKIIMDLGTEAKNSEARQRFN